MGAQNAGRLRGRAGADRGPVKHQHILCAQLGQMEGYRTADHAGTNHDHVKTFHGQGSKDKWRECEPALSWPPQYKQREYLIKAADETASEKPDCLSTANFDHRRSLYSRREAMAG
ncbi:hypothetical protein [Achromobacter marplatensis]|uniref:hypothetical protein n=1 Tax=Achromobacter marplatensis TaxID=470868 RepID=UPI003CFD82B1